MVDRYWKRWVHEYLPIIARRTKWFVDVEPIMPNDLVMIVNDSTRNGWIRGRVLEIITGPDGRCRQAVVRTSTGVYKRAVAKLARLDVRSNQQMLRAGEHVTWTNTCPKIDPSMECGTETKERYEGCWVVDDRREREWIDKREEETRSKYELNKR